MVAQLGLCVFLTVCVVVMAAQLRFLQRQDLGFDGDHVVAVSLHNSGTPATVAILRQRLLATEGVVAVSAAEHCPAISYGTAIWRRQTGEIVLNGFRVARGSWAPWACAWSPAAGWIRSRTPRPGVW